MIVVIAQPEEIKLVKELGLQEYPIIITGVGGVNVINALKHIPKDEYIFNVGYAGSNNIEIGTKVAITSAETLHEKANFMEKSLGCYVEAIGNKLAPCYTSTDFVTHTDIKEDCVFDMELAYICAMFDKVYSIKFVSDNLNKKEYDDHLRGHQTKGNRTRKQT